MVGMSVDDDFGWALGVVFRAYLRSAITVTDGVPGGHRGYQVLLTAARAAPNSQSALGKQLGIDRTGMTYLLDDLERAGLVERRLAPGDRRIRHVVATPHGHELLQDLDTRLAQIEAHLLAGLPEDEQEAFTSQLRRLASHVNGLDPVANTCAIVEDITTTRP
jgi:DNA-binding MarR family transcriptional regulator